MKRRDFLIAGAALGVAGLGCLGGCSSYTGSARVSGGGVAGRHWGFVVDVERFNREADMGKIQAASYNYAGNSSCYRGYFWCAYYYGDQNGYRLK